MLNATYLRGRIVRVCHPLILCYFIYLSLDNFYFVSDISMGLEYIIDKFKLINEVINNHFCSVLFSVVLLAFSFRCL